MSTIDVDKLKSLALDIKALDITKPYLLIVRISKRSGQAEVDDLAHHVYAAVPKDWAVVFLPDDVTAEAYEVRARITNEIKVRVVPTSRDDQLAADLPCAQPAPQ